MPSYRNNHIGIASLLCFLLWSAPAVAQRSDTEQPLSLIGDAANFHAGCSGCRSCGRQFFRADWGACVTEGQRCAGEEVRSSERSADDAWTTLLYVPIRRYAI